MYVPSYTEDPWRGCETAALILIFMQNLPQTFQHYRPIQGDGNCGWRGKSLSFT
jgi:hypothetical protein